MALVFVFFVAVFVVLFLFLLPILFSLQAVGSLFVYPRQLRTILGNKILRRNHALEHATIVVMMEREPGRKLNGFSTDEGFFVQGVRSIPEVESAAREALRRLRGGERGLAIHRNCGTTIVAANLLAAVFFIGAVALGFAVGGQWLYLLILGGVLLAFALRVPLSLVLQRFVTTDADLTNAEVGWVEPSNPADLRGGILGMLLAASTVRVRVFHTDPDAVEIVRDDGAVVRWAVRAGAVRAGAVRAGAVREPPLPGPEHHERHAYVALAARGERKLCKTGTPTTCWSSVGDRREFRWPSSS